MLRPLLAAACCIVAAATTGSARAAGPLETAVFDPPTFSSGSSLAFARTGEAGAASVRFLLQWSAVAPESRPPSFDPGNPADPAYSWTTFDLQVQNAVANGLQPIVTIYQTPVWAREEPGAPTTSHPNLTELWFFARAAARRYDGSFGGLPRVRFWQVWNEPNLALFFTPQYVDGEPFSPGRYRQMTNIVAGAVRSVRADNLVVAGGLAPFAAPDPDPRGITPLHFMREFLCLSADADPQPTCTDQVALERWSMHPYSWSGPRGKATVPDDVSIADLPRMKALLDVGVQKGRINAVAPVAFWVTEFSWDSNPPDPAAAPMALQVRWTAESMYWIWRGGVSLVTWFLLRDQPFPATAFQSGLYFRGATGIPSDTPKPTLRAFRFPLVAYPSGGGVRVWTRTPGGQPGTVILEQTFRGGWRTLAERATDSHGIVDAAIPRTNSFGYVRARLANGTDATVPFSLRRPREPSYPPFGS